jgi:hypothetical protein
LKYSRTVDYVRCRTCGIVAYVQFAHGAIEVNPCRKCCTVRGMIKRLIVKMRGK